MYYNKYIKYKTKYLNLLNDLSGGVGIIDFFTSDPKNIISCLTVVDEKKR
jgi:hypothetical protein